LSEVLPYIVFAGSVAAVLAGIGIKIILERDSEGIVIQASISASHSGHKGSLLQSGEETPTRIAEDSMVSTSHNVKEPDRVSGNAVVSPTRSEPRKRKRRRRVGKRLERKILRLYKKGKSPKEIAEELGISTSTVYRKIKKLAPVGS